MAPHTVILSEDAAPPVILSEVAAAAESKDTVSPPARASEDFAPAFAPPEDLTLESARPDPQDAESMWKQEVASRLENYRSRRGTRRPRYNGSLSLDFDRATNRMMAATAEEPVWDPLPPEPSPSLDDTSAEDASQFFGASIDYQEIQAEEPPENNLIEFPRLPTLFDSAPTGYELAEPVVDKPRILYVPEEVPTAQAPLENIQLDPSEPADAPVIELPLCIAPVGHRTVAALADAVIVAIAAAVFLAVVLRQVPAPDSRLGYALVAALPVVLWAIYEYLFLVYSDATPGMLMAHLSLASFDPQPIGRRTRRLRALAAMLSTFSLCLGHVWALLDEDTLCWHDRISRTYLVLPQSDYES